MLFRFKNKVATKQKKELIESFFDENNKLNKNQLKEYVSESLSVMKMKLDVLLYREKYKKFWADLQNYCAINHKADCLAACKEVLLLPKLIDYWEKESVESDQRFDFFIVSKASELASGDEVKDYYHALLIRHDQLLAVVEVFQEAINFLEEIVTNEIKYVPNSSQINFFSKWSVEKRIFITAENFYKLRKDLGKL